MTAASPSTCRSARASDRTGSIYEYSRLKGITLQAWSPFQKGYFEGTFLGDTEHYGKLNETIRLLAEKYGVTDTAIAVAWLTRVPSGIQVILGTTKPQRLIDGCKGSEIPLTRKEWFSLYAAAGNMIPKKLNSLNPRFAPIRFWMGAFFVRRKE